MTDLNGYFDRFLRERVYLHNITPKTRDYYVTAWKAFVRAHAEAPIRTADAPIFTRADLQHFIVHLRERGVKAVTCNCWLRGLNAFGRWLHAEGVIPQPVRLRPQKEEKRLLALHDQTALRALISYRPKTYIQWRVHSVACTILDTGCRIEELLTARVSDFDCDNLLLTVVGKGRKQRKVPFSIELRKVLFRFAQVKGRADVRSDLMFPARDGGKWEHRNARRSYYCLLKNLGLPQTGFHLLRHTFATEYLRSGGDVVRLSIILGHTEVGTTMKYLHLLTDDLQRPHQSLSILNRLR
jgi:integrase/recombinase XerD